jgi:hypothetical protein
MKEKDIENLIARYPQDFFPKGDFKLLGQQVRLGNCYADIIFTDKYDRKVIIEVKRGILSRDAAGQIIEYYGLLKLAEPDVIVELIVCANTIPHERKLFLENVGIECKELGLSLIQNVADKYNYKFLDESVQLDIAICAGTNQKVRETDYNIDDSQANIWIFQANPDRYDILNILSDSKIQRYTWQVNQYKDKIKKGDIALIWMSGKEAGIYALAEIVTNPSKMGDLPGEEKYWVDDKDKGQKALKVELVNKILLINHPLFRDELKAIADLGQLHILRVAQGTNFPVSSAEWSVIKELIDGKKDNQALDILKLKLADDYIHDTRQKEIFLTRATQYKMWANYIAGLILSNGNYLEFHIEDIKRVLKSLLGDLYDGPGAKESGLLTADMADTSNWHFGYPCLQKVPGKRGYYTFIGFPEEDIH